MSGYGDIGTYSGGSARNLSQLSGHRVCVGLANIDVGIASRVVVFDDQNEFFSGNDLRDPDFVYIIIFSLVSPGSDEPIIRVDHTQCRSGQALPSIVLLRLRECRIGTCFNY